MSVARQSAAEDRPAAASDTAKQGLAVTLEDLHAYYGNAEQVKGIDLAFGANQVTAIIGPSGCGKSTMIRCINRMHEEIPGARAEGRVLLDDANVYDAAVDVVAVRRAIGMVFQKANPFPTMSIYDNVIAGLDLTGRKIGRDERDALVERSLTRAGLWAEVSNRLATSGGALSGGQQQRLCIARALAVDPEVLLMDEPCSALDPTSTRRVEETIAEIRTDMCVVIVTHNMQQAARVSEQCAFFLAAENTPGHIVESGRTSDLFGNPQDERTADYVNGRFG